MHTDSSKQFHANRWLYVFIAIHLICWTVVPALLRYNLPLDSIEGTIWGQHLQWGYDKNPFLNGWLTALAIHLSSPSGWMIYLFSQLSVTICFWATWRLAKEMLPPSYALISVMLLEGIQYYNFHAIDFNDNTLELSTWALTTYFFYCALRSQKIFNWMLTGLFAGLGMMAKYYTAALLTAMIIFVFAHSSNRQQLKTLPPYIGLLTFIAVILPHTIWLCFHDFITVKYVFRRAATLPHWKNHFIFPILFLWQQLQVLLPALFFYVLLFLGKKPRILHNLTLTKFNQSFLLFIGVGPLILTVFLPIIFGNVLRAGYGQPLLSLWGIILIALIQPNISMSKIHVWLASFYTIMLAFVCGYAFSLIDSKDPTTANFPGDEIAKAVTQIWHDRYHTDLKYVAGSRWIGGNVGFYSADHPTVFLEWDEHRSPWVNTQDLLQKGGIFIWDHSNKESLPRDVPKRFPPLVPVGILTIPYKRNTRHLPPVEIGMGILAPASQR